MTNIVRTAQFSEDRLYRYLLTRTWSEKPPLCLVMLNPSSADDVRDDATITRQIKRAQLLNHGSLIVANLFAYIATKPAELMRARRRGVAVCGQDNFLAHRKLLDMACSAGARLLVAWGPWASGIDPGAAVRFAWLANARGVQPYCLAVTRFGDPVHPLYQPYSAILRAYQPR